MPRIVEPEAPVMQHPPAPPPLLIAGRWRGELASPGGELPFAIEIENDGTGALVNADARAPLTDIAVEDGQFRMRVPGHDASIAGVLADRGARLAGTWTAATNAGEIRMSVVATRIGADMRFGPTDNTGADAIASVAGSWSLQAGDAPNGRAELASDGDRVTGWIELGGARYEHLDGTYARGFLRLSTFDGYTAVLVHGRAHADGNLAGTLWSNRDEPLSWTGRPSPSQ